ncbi:MAG: AAA family ATPase, partial [Myxococcales bacterium]|nr:AAA family ATPase [Myxococcales bacterium]
MVTLRLEGIDHLEGVAGPVRGEFALAQLKKTLGDIAYKHGAEWQWQGNRRAQAVIGLWSNSSRAAIEAAWLAIDVHEAMGGASEDLEVPIQAGIAIVRGVASGEREAGGRLVRHTLLPPAEYLTAFLGERAPWGATWVAGGLYRMIRREFRWGDVPPLEVPPQPGLALPRVLRVYALQRPLSREERSAESALAAGDLVGRDAEKADLHAAYHRAVSPEDGSRGAMLSRAVVGEMGIGKSALVAAFLAELPPEAKILRYEASPARSDIPFGAVAELARDAMGVAADAPRNQILAKIHELLGERFQSAADHLGDRLADLLTGHTEAAQDADDLVYRRRMISASVRRLLALLASQQPLVIVCDGLQWFDRPSLDLIGELIRREEALPILTLLITRNDDRLLAQLEGVVRLDLQGLSREDQIRLVEARLGVRKGVAAICAELLPRVAGNPFFLLEMIDALLERGALELQQGEDGEGELIRVEQGQVPLPSTLEQILGDRIRELSEYERGVVEWLAVAGGPLHQDTLSHLLGPEPVQEAVPRLCARGLCDLRGEQLDFRHSITRDVAYLNLEPRRRQQLHRRLGEFFLSTSPAQGLAAAVVAKHLARGGDWEQAADLYLEAASTARRTHQTQLAVRYYQRALKLLPPEDLRRLEAHEALEAAYRVVGRRRERKEQLASLRRIARISAHPRWVAVALARSARFDLDEGNLLHGVSLARQAAEVARLARSPVLELEAQNITSELLRELGDLPGALEACDAALDVARRHGEISPRNRADVLRARGAILRRLGRVAEAIEAYAEAIALCRSCGARRLEARARNSLAMAMLVSERWEDA